jgi:hypothetical protein
MVPFMAPCISSVDFFDRTRERRHDVDKGDVVTIGDDSLAGHLSETGESMLDADVVGIHSYKTSHSMSLSHL